MNKTNIENFIEKLKKQYSNTSVVFTYKEIKNGNKTAYEIIGSDGNQTIKLSFSDDTNSFDTEKIEQKFKQFAVYDKSKEVLKIKLKLDNLRNDIDYELNAINYLQLMSCKQGFSILDNLYYSSVLFKTNNDIISNVIKDYLIKLSPKILLTKQNEYIKYKKQLKSFEFKPSTSNNLLKSNNNMLLGCGTTQTIMPYNPTHGAIQVSVNNLPIINNYKHYDSVEEVLEIVQFIHNDIECLNDKKSDLGTINDDNMYIYIKFYDEKCTNCYLYKIEREYISGLKKVIEDTIQHIISEYENELNYLFNTIEML